MSKHLIATHEERHHKAGEWGEWKQAINASWKRFELSKDGVRDAIQFLASGFIEQSLEPKEIRPVVYEVPYIAGPRKRIWVGEAVSVAPYDTSLKAWRPKKQKSDRVIGWGWARD